MLKNRRWKASVAGVIGLCALLLALPALGEAQRAVLTFAGDCTLGSTDAHQRYARGFVSMIGDLGFDYPFSGVQDIFAGDDLTLVNLEGTFTDSRNAADKSFVFRAPPAYAEILTLGSVEAVNIANNHIDDFLARGREDTLAALDAQGVLYSGDGILATIEVQGIKIGMTGYSYPHRRTLEMLAEDIAALRAQGCEVIIFSMHAGREEQYMLTGTQMDIARGAIDLGADIVVGHHAHVVQTVEVYQGRPIFYGLGNFAFGGNINPKDWGSLIGQVVLEKDEDGVRLTEMRILPCLISEAGRYSDFRPVPAQGEDRDKIMASMRKYAHQGTIDETIFDTGVLRLDTDLAATPAK